MQGINDDTSGAEQNTIFYSIQTCSQQEQILFHTAELPRLKGELTASTKMHVTRQLISVSGTDTLNDIKRCDCINEKKSPNSLPS